MSDRKNTKSPKSFPWKAVFGVICIIGVMVLLSKPNNPISAKDVSSSETNQSSLSGFSLNN
jgi:hypothetical protein